MTGTLVAPHSLEAEKALLGALLIGADAGAIFAKVQPPDFYSPRHRAIFEALVAVHASGGVLDPVTVATEATRQGHEQITGGIVAVLALADDCPTHLNAAHYAELVRTKAVARETMKVGTDLAKASADEGASAMDLLASARQRIEILTRRLEGPRAATGAISSAWQDLDPVMLNDQPPVRRWLLRRPTRDGKPSPPSLGDGLLPLGKVGLLVADGGVGKTMALVALGLSVITGQPWLGYFHVPAEARGGKVLLLLAEEDIEEVHRRIYSVACAYALSPEERERVARQLVVLPLAGLPVALVTETGLESPELTELRARLDREPGPQGWSLVGMDPFSRFSAAESELDNAIATRTIQAAEALVRAPGGPTVILAHHAPQASLTAGAAVRSRGVTGIRNAVRWEGTLRQDGPDVFFKQAKSNYSMPMRDELRLVRGPGGLLRVASDEEEQDRRERRDDAKESTSAEKEARREARIGKVERAILDAMASAAQPPCSQSGLTALVGGNQQDRVDAVGRLIATGRVLRPEGRGLPYRLASLIGTQVGLGLELDP